MGLERSARAWAHRHGLWRWRIVVSAYRAYSRLRFHRHWDDPLLFRGCRFRIGRDLSLYPAVHNGGFESVELDAFLPRVPRDAEVWDVGANVGIYSVLLSSASPDGHVQAFEPVPETNARLRGNLDLNGTANVTVHEVALSSSTGTAGMGIHSDAHGCDSLVLDDAADTVISVPTMTANDFLMESGSRPPDVIKIDIEGHEPDFFDGAWEIIERHRPLLMLEVNPAAWFDTDLARRWQMALDRLLATYGNGVWIGPDSTREVDAVDVGALEPHGYTLILPSAAARR